MENNEILYRKEARRKRAVQQQLLAKSLAAGKDPNKAAVTQKQMQGVKLPKIMRFQTPDGHVMESSEDRLQVFMKQNPKTKILGVVK